MSQMFNDDISVSVVVPVFNAAPFLERCVTSVRQLAKQANLFFEIILVDDGSTDESPVLCDRLGDKVLHQCNQGVSAARNAGIDLASGSWIWFVDADDYIDSLQRPVVVPTDADFIVLGYIWDENNREEVFGASPDVIPFNLWRCWFSRDKVMSHRLLFSVGRKYAEDQEFIFRYLISLKNGKKEACPDIMYHYTVRPGSAITRGGVRGKKVCDILSVTALMWACAIKHLYFPNWIWFQTRRLLKTAWVSFVR